MRDRLSRPPSARGRRASPVLADDFRDDAEEGPRRGAGLGGDGTGDGSDKDGAGFGLPPGVDDGAAARGRISSAIPHPGFRVDGFADGAEQTE